MMEIFEMRDGRPVRTDEIKQDVWINLTAPTAEEIERYYEGFSNDTLWPLYHDVIAQPGYHRTWWESYMAVNARFAAAAAASKG